MLNILTSAASQAEQVAPQLFFDPAKFISNLKYMGIGMLVIFVIIGVIILSTSLINYLFSEQDN